MDFGAVTDRFFPAVTNEDRRYGDMIFFAQGGITCYVIKGKNGDLLIDTGMPHTWEGLRRFTENHDIRHVLLTHAHADHDWNVTKLQKLGADILLNERDRTLRQNFLSQRVKPTMPKYAFHFNLSFYRRKDHDSGLTLYHVSIKLIPFLISADITCMRTL